MKKIILLTMLFIGLLPAATVTTNKTIYTTNERVTITFSGMKAHKDWIGIYPAGSSNAWSNMIKWAWTKDTKRGNHIFKNLPNGNYEVRVFFDNSFKTAASYRFKVLKDALQNTTVTTNKTTYTSNEKVIVNFAGMKAHKDWIGIYPADSSNAWSKMIKWAWTKDIKRGNHTFQNLPNGNYEVRVFFDNSFTTAASKAFTIKKSIDNNIIHTRASKCLSNEGNKDKQVLCFNEQDEDIVYVIENKEVENNIYKVNLAKGIHGVELTKTIEKMAGQPNAYFVPLKNTTLIAIYRFQDLADPEEHIAFYYQTKKLQLSLDFGDVTGKYNGKYKTIEHGQKLEVTYKEADNVKSVGKKYREIYDISNPSNVQLISKTQI